MTRQQVRVDIVSDVMCPWCIIGYKELEAAAAQSGAALGIRWHPFELNPDMAADGEDLTDHVTRKYGISPAQSAQNRAALRDRGAALGLDFSFSEGARIRNSFRAHQLVDWAEDQGAQHRMKLALFAAHFSAGLDVNDIDVLAQVAETVDLDAAAARAALESGAHADPVRRKQAFWQQQGVTGVPAMVFDQQYLVTGAQGCEGYAHILRQLGTAPA
jgi:predicted DsbA family dithiol-disulfide isomerase